MTKEKFIRFYNSTCGERATDAMCHGKHVEVKDGKL